MRPALLGLAGLLAAAGPVCGQTLNRDELLDALRQRDQAIAALEKRVEALEAEKRAPSPSAIAVIDPAGSPAAQTPATAGPEDDAALQALSRGLVERGALVLPKWSAEITPSLSYSHSVTQGLVLVDTPEGVSTVDSQRLRDDGLHGLIGLRVGLPWRSQFEVQAPYDWMRENSALGDGSQKTNSAAGVGDIQLELSHQFLQEQGWRPDLIGAFSWRFPTGRDPFRTSVAGIANGSGSDRAGVRVTALKSADPIVFFTSLSYGANLATQQSFGSVHPGDSIEWQVGGLLSVSPDTSLSLNFTQDFTRRTTVNGAPIPGSDQVASVVQVGLDQVLTHALLLDVSLGLGVTRDAPNYVFQVSLPLRFR
ncbi:MAG TPA: transporter [Caulobacteraceae bacterium]|jgi:hypothetical protein